MYQWQEHEYKGVSLYRSQRILLLKLFVNGHTIFCTFKTRMDRRNDTITSIGLRLMPILDDGKAKNFTETLNGLLGFRKKL